MFFPTAIAVDAGPREEMSADGHDAGTKAVLGAGEWNLRD